MAKPQPTLRPGERAREVSVAFTFTTHGTPEQAVGTAAELHRKIEVLLGREIVAGTLFVDCVPCPAGQPLQLGT